MVANVKPDQWDEYISILKPQAKIILVTVGSDTLGIPVYLMLRTIILVSSHCTERIENIWILHRLNCFQERNEFDVTIRGSR